MNTCIYIRGGAGWDSNTNTYLQDQSYQDQSYQDQSYQDQSYQDQSYQDQSYQEPAHEPAYEEQSYQEPAADAGQWEGQEQQYPPSPLSSSPLWLFKLCLTYSVEAMTMEANNKDTHIF